MAFLGQTLETVILLLLLASLVGAWFDRLHVPYTVGLVIVGVVLDLAGALPPTALNPDVVLLVLLPPLLFEAAFVIRWRHLGKVAVSAIVLSTVGVVLAAGVTASAMVLVLNLPWVTAGLFGALVAATDPVAVVSFFRRAHVAPELRALVEGESLLNDGTAVILVGVVVGLAAEGTLNVGQAVVKFLAVAIGGLAVGAVVGTLAAFATRGAEDYLLDSMLTVVAAYGSYLVGQSLGVSGILAAVAAGSVLGNLSARFGLSAHSRESIVKLWEFLAFVANSLVFLLLGVAVRPTTLAQLPVEIIAGVLAMLLGRLVVVYGLGGALAALGEDLPHPWRTVLFVGALRGALPVVVAYGVSAGAGSLQTLPNLVLGVVVVSLTISGIALEPTLRRVLRPADAK